MDLAKTWKVEDRMPWVWWESICRKGFSFSSKMDVWLPLMVPKTLQLEPADLLEICAMLYHLDAGRA